jgi:hypothetical protein
VNKSGWKTKLFREKRIKSLSRGASRHPVQAAGIGVLDRREERTANSHPGDVPVFNCHRQQVGSILGVDYMSDGDGQRAHDLLSHGMNSTIIWLANDPHHGATDQLRNAVCLRRVPLMDEQNRLCGIVVLK